jgi:transposase
MSYLLDQYDLYNSQIEQLDREIEVLLENIPGAEEMIAIPGLGSTTVAKIYAEVGDIRKYRHPQQLVNLAGFL